VFKYSEKKLAKEIQKVVTRIDPTRQCAYLPEAREVTITKRDDTSYGPASIFLGNIFLHVSNMPKKERIAALESFISATIAPKEMSADETIASLALRVRTDFELDFRHRNVALRGHESKPSIRVSRGALEMEVVADGERTLSVPQPSNLAEIDVSEDEAVRIAKASLQRATDEDQWEEIEETIWASTYQDDYDFVRLVAAEESAKYPFTDQPIVFAPSHSICLVTNSKSADVLSRMIDIGNEYSAEHRPFSQLLWTPTEGTDWEVWQPSSSGELSQVALLQQIRESSNRYEETQAYLERMLGEDVFVATYNGMENDGELVSYCTYTVDLPSYLPRTDLVAVVDDERAEDEQLVGWLKWQEFETCLADKLTKSSAISIPVWFQLDKELNLSQKQRLNELGRPEPNSSAGGQKSG